MGHEQARLLIGILFRGDQKLLCWLYSALKESSHDFTLVRFLTYSCFNYHLFNVKGNNGADNKSDLKLDENLLLSENY